MEDLIRRRGRSGRTTIVASHDAGFLAGVCDRIVWLRGGKVAVEVDTHGEELHQGAAWPEQPRPLILSLQDELAVVGFDVQPRALTPGKLKARFVEPPDAPHGESPGEQAGEGSRGGTRPGYSSSTRNPM